MQLKPVISDLKRITNCFSSTSGTLQLTVKKASFVHPKMA
jgi:hypothetical protein